MTSAGHGGAPWQASLDLEVAGQKTSVASPAVVRAEAGPQRQLANPTCQCATKRRSSVAGSAARTGFTSATSSFDRIRQVDLQTQR
eukprot:715837-Amphidinium_carterae.1